MMVQKPSIVSDPIRGLFEVVIKGKPRVVEYEPDPDLLDREQVPLQEDGGIDAFLRQEVLPYATDAWYVSDDVKTGYEISFTRYFYQPKPIASGSRAWGSGQLTGGGRLT
jgi:type I restriction enzyme M protein